MGLRQPLLVTQDEQLCGTSAKPATTTDERPRKLRFLHRRSEVATHC